MDILVALLIAFMWFSKQIATATIHAVRLNPIGLLIGTAITFAISLHVLTKLGG